MSDMSGCIGGCWEEVQAAQEARAEQLRAHQIELLNQDVEYHKEEGVTAETLFGVVPGWNDNADAADHQEDAPVKAEAPKADAAPAADAEGESRKAAAKK